MKVKLCKDLGRLEKGTEVAVLLKDPALSVDPNSRLLKGRYLFNMLSDCHKCGCTSSCVPMISVIEIDDCLLNPPQPTNEDPCIEPEEWRLRCCDIEHVCPACGLDTLAALGQVRFAQCPLLSSGGTIGEGNLDSDGDGFSDADEILAGSDPADAESTPDPNTVVYYLANSGLDFTGFPFDIAGFESENGTEVDFPSPITINNATDWNNLSIDVINDYLVANQINPSVSKTNSNNGSGRVEISIRTNRTAPDGLRFWRVNPVATSPTLQGIDWQHSEVTFGGSTTEVADGDGEFNQ